MKSNTILFLLTTILLFSCKGKDTGKYFLKDKWKTKVLPYTILKNEPKKVIEYFYRGIEDINTKVLPRHGSYESFTFNKSGDVYEYKFHLSLKSSFTISYKYTDAGYMEAMTNEATKGFEEKLLLDIDRKDDGSFQETRWLDDGNVQQAIIKYTNNGNLITREISSIDSAAEISNLKTITTSEYDGQRLLQQKIVSSGAGTKITTTKQFYYSGVATDSIKVDFAGKVSKTIFVNNKQGDPLEEITIESGDTTAFYKRNYVYDQKGNWTRMLEHDLKNVKTPANGSPYILIQREIIY